MGREYNKRAVGTAGGLAGPISSMTLTDVAQTLSLGFTAVTYGTSGVSADVLVPEPAAVGDQIGVAVSNGTTSLEANFNLPTTGSVLFGTTFNTLAVASTAGSIAPSFSLVAISTSQWALASISSTVDWTISATTGSTGQA
jgi:hypothetical protein